MLAKLPDDRQSLLKIADSLEKHGWCQGTMFGVDSKRCLAGGAIYVDSLDSLKLLSSYLKLDPHCLSLLIKWNDTPGRTKEEVINTLRSAALHGL